MAEDLVGALRLRQSPVAVVLTDVRPDGAAQFKEGARAGCVMAMLLATAAAGRTAVFSRTTFGCPGGGVGLGLGEWYSGFPIERLLSTGGQVELPHGQVLDLHEGERFFDCPETGRRWTAALPFRQVPTEYVVFKPLAEVTAEETPTLVVLLVNADQLSALITLVGYRRGTIDNAIAPWGGACQAILFAYAEAEREQPRGVIGGFDIAQRHRFAPGTLTFTVPYALYQELEGNVAGSFLGTAPWLKLQERQ